MNDCNQKVFPDDLILRSSIQISLPEIREIPTLYAIIFLGNIANTKRFQKPDLDDEKLTVLLLSQALYQLLPHRAFHGRFDIEFSS